MLWVLYTITGIINTQFQILQLKKTKDSVAYLKRCPARKNSSVLSSSSIILITPDFFTGFLRVTFKSRGFFFLSSFGWIQRKICHYVQDSNAKRSYVKYVHEIQSYDLSCSLQRCTNKRLTFIICHAC